MENFKDYYANWIKKKTETQVDFISKYCEEIGIDPKTWFSFYIQRHGGDCSGSQILTDMGETFAYFLQCELEDILLKYLPPKGYNMYKEPYLVIDIEFFFREDRLFIKNKDKEKFTEYCKQLTLDQKYEIMQNKLYSYISDQTNLNICSKKDMRYMKLKKLSEL
jgi:hypothetical protein